MGKKKQIESIADLLPEGLDEATLESIAKLVDSKIKSQVKAQLDEQLVPLKAKFVSFIRTNIDKLKEQALKELELENDTFRNAQMFETIRSMFAVENTSEDEVNGLNILASMSEETEKKNGILLNQVNKLIKENVTLKKQVKVATDKNAKLTSSLTESVNALKKAGSKVSQFSDSALVISEDTFKGSSKDNKLTEEKHASDNEWIDPTVLKQFKL